MAAQNEPNFALFTCKARKFIMSSLVTFFHFNQSNKRHFNGFACAVYVFRAGIMQSIRWKMDFETKSQNTRKWRNGGIINPLFDGSTYNTSGHFAHCSLQNIRAFLAFYQHSLLNLIDVKIKPVHFWGQD